MDLQDTTRNQHFVSQVEQRLNAINPSAKAVNQKIYSFSVVDRESYEIELDSPNGLKINKTLSITDIFSFDVLEGKTERYNFEKLFHQYEVDINLNTISLISKLSNTGSDIKPEILNLFTSKLLNFVRNPYSIKKVLNTFPALKNVYPTNPVHYKNFEKVLKGRKPQQQQLCKHLGISEEEYSDWLGVIFLLLTQLEDGRTNFLEQVIKGLFENPDNFIMIIVYTYDDKTCLLSDRGYSVPLPEQEHMAWDFNLNSHGFIRYIFGDLDTLLPPNTPKSIIETYKARPRSISVSHMINDLNTLGQYNKHVVYQCYKNIFSSSIKCYGLG